MKQKILLLLIVSILIISGCARTLDVNIAGTEAFEAALETAVAETIAAADPDQDFTPEPR